MRLTGTRAYYRPTPPKMPPGLVELMEGLTKEVLKHNPSDIYGFCAGHVEQLLEKRDGPSRKKLSVEEKIVRAQEKVRQRAEKRKQEFDKNILQNKSNNNSGFQKDVNNEITLHVPQLITVSESPNPDVGSSGQSVTDSQKENVQDIVKAPILHEHGLKNASEVEISREVLATNSNIKVAAEEVVNNSKDADNFDIEISEDTNENRHIPSIILSDCKTNEYVEDNTKSEGATAHDASDIREVTSFACEEKNYTVEDSFIQEVNINSDNKGTPPDTTDIIHNSEENIVKDIKNVENTTTLIGHDRDEKLTVNSADIENNENSNVNSGTDINDTIQSNETDSNLAKIVGVGDIMRDEPEIKITDNIDQNQNNSNQVHAAMPLPSNDESDIQPEPQLSIIQESSSVKDEPQIKMEDKFDLSCNMTNTIPNTDKIDDQDIINTEDRELKGNNTNEELMETINTVIPESETGFDLPVTDVDKDIATLVTENTVNETNEIKEVNNITDTLGGMISPPVVKDSVALDKATSDYEDLSDYPSLDQDNSVDKIVNTDTHVKEANYEDNGTGQTSDNVNENAQNDNHDAGHMDLETAAVTIQKVFRNFLFKSRGSTFEDTGNDESNFLDEEDKNKEECDFPITSALNIDRRAHGMTRMDTVLQTVNEEKSLSLSDDSSTLSSAATIIQAHVRGFLVRNKLNSYKTVSTNSLAASNSNEPSVTSLEADNDHNKNKTILNIHIVPEGEHYLSRDESLITSMELSLDSSPPSSINLHPLGYDKSERRKQLKREDAIQSISPPSNNSGKLSEDFDSVKELSLNDHDVVADLVGDNNSHKDDLDYANGKDILIENSSADIAIKVNEEDAKNIKNKLDNTETRLQQSKSIIKLNSDEMDVVTPFISNEDTTLIHSGEFHDAVLPTRVSRSDTSVVSGE